MPDYIGVGEASVNVTREWSWNHHIVMQSWPVLDHCPGNRSQSAESFAAMIHRLAVYMYIQVPRYLGSLYFVSGRASKEIHSAWQPKPLPLTLLGRLLGPLDSSIPQSRAFHKTDDC